MRENFSSIASLSALRRESRHRAVYLALLYSFLAAVMLGSAFPYELGRIAPFRSFVDNIVGGAVVVLLFAIVVFVFLFFRKIALIKASALEPTRVSSIRRNVYILGKLLGVNAVAMSSGTIRDTKFSALTIGKHQIVRIGRGALSLSRRNPMRFDFCVAHELAHLASGDPRRDQLVVAFQIAGSIAIIFGLSSSYIAMAQQVAENVSQGGFRLSWFNRVTIFGILANTAAFGCMLAVLLLEGRSAQRLREFHADAVAATVLGGAVNAGIFNSDRVSPRRWKLPGVWGFHPAPSSRQAAIKGEKSPFFFDSIIFFVQGYFATLVLELLYQSVFFVTTNASASHADRAVALFNLLRHSPVGAAGAIVAFCACLVAADFLLLVRLANTMAVQQGETFMNFILPMTNGILLFIAGFATCFFSSVGNLWELERNGWDLAIAISGNMEKLQIHAISLATMSACIVLVAAQARRVVTYQVIGFVLSLLPAGSVLMLSIYWFR